MFKLLIIFPGTYYLTIHPKCVKETKREECDEVCTFKDPHGEVEPWQTEVQRCQQHPEGAEQPPDHDYYPLREPCRQGAGSRSCGDPTSVT